MDEDTKNFLQHIFESLQADNEKLGSRLETRIDALESRMDALDRRMGTMNHAITTYASHVENMLSAFASAHESLDARVSAQIADLTRRVAALEQRHPPA